MPGPLRRQGEPDDRSIPALLGAILWCRGCGENRRWPGERLCFECQENLVGDKPASEGKQR